MTSINKKSDFIQQLNSSYQSGGLSCSFSDKELVQFINWKKKLYAKGGIIRKQGVTRLGKQPCGRIWVLSPNLFLDEDGRESAQHDYVWMTNLVAFINSPKEVLLEEVTCDIILPLSTSIFSSLLDSLKICLSHNFFSGLLVLGGGAMCFHYREVIELLGCCPQVMATGPPSTGKTLSLVTALSLFGASNNKNHYTACTKSFCLQRSAASTIPFGIDDPAMAGDISDILHLLCDGKISANASQGGLQPASCRIFCTNFTFGENERYEITHLSINSL